MSRALLAGDDRTIRSLPRILFEDEVARLRPRIVNSTTTTNHLVTVRGIGYKLVR